MYVDLALRKKQLHATTGAAMHDGIVFFLVIVAQTID